jgi:hypothetical protein
MMAAAGPKAVYVVQNATIAGAGYQAMIDIQTGRILCGHMNNGEYGIHDGGDRNSGIASATGLSRLTFEVSGTSSRVWRGGVAGVPRGFAPNGAIGGSVVIGAQNAQSGLFFFGHILFLGIYNASRNTAVEAYLSQEFGV